MSTEIWVPLYRASDTRKLQPTPSADLSGSSQAILSLRPHFRLANPVELSAFQIAVADIARACSDEFSVRKIGINFHFKDQDSQRDCWPVMPLYFIGSDKSILKSSELFQKCAADLKPSVDDRHFWPGDFDVELVDFSRRLATLNYYGIPVGAIDKRNSVFIVKNASDAENIAQALPGQRLEL